MILPILTLERVLEAGGATFDGQVRLGSEPGPEHDPRILAAGLRGSVAPGSRGLDLSARLRARVETACSRCAESIEMSMNFSFRLILVARLEESGEGEREMDEEAAMLFPAQDGKVDLSEVALEQLTLNLPLKPVCSTRCLGVCPTCGANRNRIQCACRSETVDPRLAPLVELKKRMGGDS